MDRGRGLGLSDGSVRTSLSVCTCVQREAGPPSDELNGTWRRQVEHAELRHLKRFRSF